jgi:hypothetical protein
MNTEKLNLNPRMQYLLDKLSEAEQETALSFLDKIESKSFYFSPSAIKLLADNPLEFFKKYVCENFDEVETKNQKKGTLLHTLVLEPEEFDNKYIVLPENFEKPTERLLDVVNYIANLGDDSTVLDDYQEEILAYMKEIDYHQKLVDDKKDLSYTGDVKRLEKVLTDSAKTYFTFIMTSKNKEIIGKDYFDQIKEKADLIRLSESFNLISIEDDNQDFVSELELKLESPKDLLYPVKCIIDGVKIDIGNKKIKICDLKSTGNTLDDLLKWNIEKYKFGLQAATNLIAVKESLIPQLKEEIPDIEKFEIEYYFLVIDGNNTVCSIFVSEDTMNRFSQELISTVNETVKYHVDTFNFTTPLKYKDNVVIL